MKQKWTLFLLGATFFVLLTSMRMPVGQPTSTDLKVEITSINDLRIQLNAQNQTGKKLHIAVLMLERNAYNTVTETEIYSEQFAENIAEINRTLNLSQLETGNYQIRIKAGKERFERLLDIRTKPVETTNDTRIVLFK